MDQQDARIGAVVGGRYRIHAVIGAGAMATVYRGERVQLGRPVAVKFLHPALAASPELRQRFEVEARAMSRLAHPNCVSVIDFGVHEGAPYIVMEFATGKTLREVLEEERLPVGRALGVARQLLAGLAHAHEQGIIHRDVKPENVILADVTGTGDHVRILDFGLAKLRGGPASLQTQAATAVGTPSYMSPEQARAEPVDARSDVYAAGVVIFELLTGRKPFVAEEPLVVLEMQRSAPPPRLGDVASEADFSEELDAVVQKALAKDPAARHQSAVELARALEVVPEAAGRPVAPAAAPPAAAATPAATAPAANGLALAQTALLPTLAPPEVEVAQRAARPRPRGVRSSLVLLLLVVLAGTAWLIHRVGGLQLGASPTALRPDGPAGSETASFARTPAVSPASEPASVPAGETAGDEAGRGVFAAGSPTPAEEVPPGDAGPGAPRALLGDAGPPGARPGQHPADEAAEAEEQAEPVPPVPAEPVVEEKIDPQPRRPEPRPTEPPPAKSLAQVKSLIAAGRTDEAIAGLQHLRRANRRNPYLWYLLGSLYFDKHYWSDGIQTYRAAIQLNPAYRKRSVLIRNAIRALGSDKTHVRASTFLRKDVGAPAASYLKQAARSDRDPKVRARAARLLKAPRAHRTTRRR